MAIAVGRPRKRQYDEPRNQEMGWRSPNVGDAALTRGFRQNHWNVALRCSGPCGSGLVGAPTSTNAPATTTTNAPVHDFTPSLGEPPAPHAIAGFALLSRPPQEWGILLDRGGRGGGVGGGGSWWRGPTNEDSTWVGHSGL